LDLSLLQNTSSNETSNILALELITTYLKGKTTVGTLQNSVSRVATLT